MTIVELIKMLQNQLEVEKINPDTKIYIRNERYKSFNEVENVTEGYLTGNCFVIKEQFSSTLYNVDDNSWQFCFVIE